MAKLNFRNIVKQTDVDEALRLMDFSIRSLRKISGVAKDKSRARKEDAKENQMGMVTRKVREALAVKTNMTVNQVLNEKNMCEIS
jgi:DNA replicative helicase MCM subunit Mcm2 (Cdc46/Mcm family)